MYALFVQFLNYDRCGKSRTRFVIHFVWSEVEIFINFFGVSFCSVDILLPVGDATHKETIGMTVMAKVSASEICDNAKMARDMALTGNYDAAGIYYEGVLQSLQKHIVSITDHIRKQKWIMVRSKKSFLVRILVVSFSGCPT